MTKTIRDIIDKTWNWKSDIPSVLEVIRLLGKSFSKDDVLEIFNALFSK